MTSQTRKDLIRTAASITAYAVIGIIVAGGLWFVIAVVGTGLQDLFQK